MKKVVFILIVAMLCASVFAGCTKNTAKEDQAVNNASGLSKEESLTVDTSPNNSNATDEESKKQWDSNEPITLKMVLKNQAPYYCAYDKNDKSEKDIDTKYLDAEFSNDGVTNSAKLKPFQFAVVDMDGDKQQEAVVQLNSDDTIVFYKENNKVYRVYKSIRQMGLIKTDGTFNWSGSVSNFGVGKLCMNGNLVSVKNIVFKDSDEYYANDEKISENEFYEQFDEQEKKQDVTWYDFTDENIEKILG